jgi:hydrogenase maturation protease
MTPSVLIAGLGNIFLGDDAFGSEVARRLLSRDWPDEVRVVDFGIRGLDLMFSLLDGYDTVILVDATPRGGAPGTLYTIEPDISEIDAAEPEAAAIETHSMDPMRVLAAARATGAQFHRILLVGCEPSPESADPNGPGSIGLTTAVANAVDEAISIVAGLVEEALAKPSRRTSPRQSGAGASQMPGGT